jgi:hypothetical protein
MHVKIGTNVWKIPVLDGFSFSQATNVSEIGLNEMESTAGVSRRGRKSFNDSLAAAEFSFSTYIRPFKAVAGSAAGTADTAAKVHAVEEVLWALFGGPAAYTGYSFTDQFNTDTTKTVINLNSSNVSTLGPDSNTVVDGTAGCSIFFQVGDANKIVYELKKAVLNEATINFDIDGIAQVDWSGMASEIGTTEAFPAATIYEETTGTDNFIRNRLTTLAVQVGTCAVPIIQTEDGVGYTTAPTITFDAPSGGGTTATAIGEVSGGNLTKVIMTNAGSGYTAAQADGSATDFVVCTGGGGSTQALLKCSLNADMNPTGDASAELEESYSVTLTGGSITMTNNITYVTPEELGIVNVATGHVTGSRAVSGNFTCYLTEDTDTTQASRDLFDHMQTLTTVTSNKFDLRFSIGGAAGTPRLEIHCPQAHIDIPTHSIEDLITLDTTFNALPSTLDTADDADLIYVAT